MAALLENRVAVVTGAAKGIGREICLKASEYGAHIVALDIDFSGAKATAEEISAFGGRAIAAQCDVSDKEDVERAFALAMKEYERVDILSNNAGICIPAMMTEVTESDWDRTFAVNCKGAMLMCQAAAKIMKEQNFGRIIVTASQAGRVGEYANGPYSISKASIAMMVQVLAMELSKYNILSNSISPGFTDTQFFRNKMVSRAKQEGHPVKEVISNIMQGVPIGRPCQPEEIAELVCFLGSEKNSYITGTDILISGGGIMY